MQGLSLTRDQFVRTLQKLGYQASADAGVPILTRDQTKAWMSVIGDGNSDYKKEMVLNFWVGKKYVPQVQPNRDKIAYSFYRRQISYRFRVDGVLEVMKQFDLRAIDSEQSLKLQLDSCFDTLSQLESGDDKNVFVGGTSPYAPDPVRTPDPQARVQYLDGEDAQVLVTAWGFRAKGGFAFSSPVWLVLANVNCVEILLADAHPSHPEGKRVGFEMSSDLSSTSAPDDSKIDWNGFDMHSVSLSPQKKPRVWVFVSLEDGLSLGEIKQRLERFAEICKQLSKLP